MEILLHARRTWWWVFLPEEGLGALEGKGKPLREVHLAGF
jgi:hypothetical protein